MTNEVAKARILISCENNKKCTSAFSGESNIVLIEHNQSQALEFLT